MARRKREPMSEGKKNIIGMLLEKYDIKSAKDIEDALKVDVFAVRRKNIKVAEALHTQQSIVFRNDRKSEVCKLLFDLGF